MFFRKALFSLATALLLVNSAATQGQIPLTEIDKVTGRLSISGKAVDLNHIYAHRMRHSTAGRDREVLALILTNKALSTADQQGLIERYPFTQVQQELINDKTVTGLFLTIEKKNLRPVIYFEYIISAGRANRRGVGQFLEFNLSNRRMTGKAAGEPVEADEADKKTLKLSYTARFEATLRGEPLYKALEGAAAPGASIVTPKQGTAQGTLTAKGITINLKYAYAVRTRLFFDEPEESIKVLITDRPLSEEDLLHTLRNDAPLKKSFQGILLSLASYKAPGYGMIIFHKSLESGYLTTGTKAEDITITKESIVASSAGEENKSTDNWAYSVWFNAPFNK